MNVKQALPDEYVFTVKPILVKFGTKLISRRRVCDHSWKCLHKKVYMNQPYIPMK